MTTDAPVIHIVDDDESFRRSVARLLRVSGYQVALYDSANRLLQTPSAMTPGCILLDVRMPGVSGPELQARLVAAGNPLPIVFLTGHGDIPTSVKAIKAGAEDFLSKPVSRKTLIAIQRAPVRYARALWLAALERMAPADAADVMLRDLYIHDLRRRLGLGQPIEVVRAQTRERVRRLRARRKADAGKRA